MNSILPRVIDNSYTGHRAAIWILVPVVFAVLLIEQLRRKLILWVKSPEGTSTATVSGL